jgi:uncharacterized membrane protein SpoIIM required for sporulation
MPRVFKLDEPSNDLNKLTKSKRTLPQSKEITVSKSTVPIFAIVLLAIVFVFGLFLVGFDQGHIFSVVLGEQAYEDLYIHELTHDMRHASGFPCH